MTLNATEKFAVLYERFPRVVHVLASDDEAYSTCDPVYQNAQWLLEPES
jgi:hypothetical protein